MRVSGFRIAVVPNAARLGRHIGCMVVQFRHGGAMRVVEIVDATDTLADYTAQIESGPLIVTNHGRPVAALVPIENADLETAALSTNPQFLELIERSRACVQRAVSRTRKCVGDLADWLCRKP